MAFLGNFGRQFGASWVLSKQQHEAALNAQSSRMMNVANNWPDGFRAAMGAQDLNGPRRFLRPPPIGPAPSFLRRLLRGRARSPLLTTWEAGK